jgi:3-phenylpropionate/trans-cinnamate dioxygenase ferredoxin subunit
VLLTALAHEFEIDIETALREKFFTRDGQRSWQTAKANQTPIQTEEPTMTEGRVSVGKVADFVDNSMAAFEIAGHDVLVVYQGGKFYALEDRCTHDNGILHDGELLDGAVKCERHGAKFNLETGKPTLPAIKKIRLYQTEVADGEVFVHYQEA